MDARTNSLCVNPEIIVDKCFQSQLTHEIIFYFAPLPTSLRPDSIPWEGIVLLSEINKMAVLPL
jgi:hypothetical protein